MLAAGEVSVASVSGAAIATGIIAASSMFAFDRNALLQKLALQDMKRHAAEEIAESKTRFLAIMSHELKTPLAAVIGYSELLEEDLAGRGLRVQADDAARIHRAAVGQLGVIKNVLEMARLETGRSQTHDEICDVRSLVADVLHDVAYLAKLNNNKLVSELEKSVQMAEVDAGKLRQCLMNLLSNACKFTCEGEVRFSAAWRQDDNGDLLSFQIRDTGVGIEQQALGSLFEAFSQSDKSSRQLGGSGLGLSIVRQFARLMGGDVECESVRGSGTTFTLWVRAKSLPNNYTGKPSQISRAA
jgi:signal transduction histidine kinase